MTMFLLAKNFIITSRRVECCLISTGGSILKMTGKQRKNPQSIKAMKKYKQNIVEFHIKLIHTLIGNLYYWERLWSIKKLPRAG